MKEAFKKTGKYGLKTGRDYAAYSFLDSIMKKSEPKKEDLKSLEDELNHANHVLNLVLNNLEDIKTNQSIHANSMSNGFYEIRLAQDNTTEAIKNLKIAAAHNTALLEKINNNTNITQAEYQSLRDSLNNFKQERKKVEQQMLLMQKYTVTTQLDALKAVSDNMRSEGEILQLSKQLSEMRENWGDHHGNTLSIASQLQEKVAQKKSKEENFKRQLTTFQEATQLTGMLIGFVDPKFQRDFNLVAQGGMSIFMGVSALSGGMVLAGGPLAPYLAIASGVQAFVGLFSEESNGLEEAFSALFEQLREISKQIFNLHADMLSEFKQVKEALHYIRADINTNFEILKSIVTHEAASQEENAKQRHQEIRVSLAIIQASLSSLSIQQSQSLSSIYNRSYELAKFSIHTDRLIEQQNELRRIQREYYNSLLSEFELHIAGFCWEHARHKFKIVSVKYVKDDEGKNILDITYQVKPTRWVSAAECVNATIAIKKEFELQPPISGEALLAKAQHIKEVVQIEANNKLIEMQTSPAPRPR